MLQKNSYNFDRVKESFSFLFFFKGAEGNPHGHRHCFRVLVSVQVLPTKTLFP